METVANGGFLESAQTKEIQKIVALLKTLPDSFANKVYAVGGCVRDAILGIDTADIDIASAILPQDFLQLCQEAELPTYLTGLDHGTITFSLKGLTIEHTTFRKDVATDGRNATIAFADTIHADALRRDFKINALYLNSSGELFDPTGGYATLQALKAEKLAFLETVGPASERFAEDYLRVLRAIRFSKKFSINLSVDIIYELEQKFQFYKIQLEQKVSKERRVEEFRKLISLSANLRIFETFLTPTPPNGWLYLYFPTLDFQTQQAHELFINSRHVKIMLEMSKLLYFSKVNTPEKVNFILSLFIGLFNSGYRSTLFLGVDNDICNRGYLISKLIHATEYAKEDPIWAARLWLLKREFFNLLVNKEESWALWCWLCSELDLTIIAKELKKGFAFALAAFYDPELLKGPQINERQCDIFCQQMSKN